MYYLLISYIYICTAYIIYSFYIYTYVNVCVLYVYRSAQDKGRKPFYNHFTGPDGVRVHCSCTCDQGMYIHIYEYKYVYTLHTIYIRTMCYMLLILVYDVSAQLHVYLTKCVYIVCAIYIRRVGLEPQCSRRNARCRARCIKGDRRLIPL